MPARLPWLTASVCGASLAAACSTAFTQWLQYDRDAVIAGQQYWRLLTSHLAHWNISHLVWDLAVFALLGWACERRNASLTRWLTLAGAVAISAAILLATPHMRYYRGLSGLDAMLFTVAAVLYSRSKDSETPLFPPWTAGVCVAVAAGKSLIEYATGSTLFAASGTDFVPVPLAHLVGALIGALPLCWLRAAHTARDRANDM